jgi:hypothetical protein
MQLGARTALPALKGEIMTMRGPEDRERFARREEPGVPLTSARTEQRASARVVAGGSLTEAVCGAATVILAIIALAGAAPRYFAPVAAIVFGVALIAHGGAVAARMRELFYEEAAPSERTARVELGGGMGAELIGGVAGVVLGILALIGIAPSALIGVAVLVFGGALLLGSGETAELGAFGESAVHQRLAHAAYEASKAAAGVQALAGAGAIVLGILALVGLAPMELALVALLVLGSAVVLSGSAVSSRMASVIRR